MLPTSLLSPPPLKPGDTLHVVAPSGGLRETEAFQQGVQLWQDRGYQLTLAPGWDNRHGYLAGTDAQRRQQLRETLRNPDVKAVLCARGGYGGTRLLEQWDWERDITPKWLVGFSDITSLLWSLAKQGIAGVHGPLLTTLAAEPEASQQRLFNWVEGKAIAPLQGCGWGGAKVRGRLFPGNLTVATHLIGTPHEPDLRGAILAFEDTGEAPYRLDRLLTHWRMSGRFEGIAGIALGRFSRCEVAEGVPSFSVEEVMRDRLSDLGIPVVSDLRFGHDGENAALPVGIVAELDGEEGTLNFAPSPTPYEVPAP
jgi:muramoyltetrapeptide carboxypeptidase